jgi:DNA-binding NarL/FixJ family response regulator
MSTQKILVADDHPIFREGMRALLAKMWELEIIGEAGNGQHAVELARQIKPDLILMGLKMPVLNGLEATRIIKQHQPALKIIALTAIKTRDHVEAALAAGANGYVLKDDSIVCLMNAIDSVLNGQTYLSPGISGMEHSSLPGNSENTGPVVSWGELTRRERDIIKLIAEGYKNREIATCLSLSLKSVEKYRSSLMSKLNLRSVSAMTAFAIEHSLISI